MARSFKKVYGMGVNDSPDQTQWFDLVGGKRVMTQACPFYKAWTSMLKRAYCPLWKAKHPTYEGVTVCEDWLSLTKFKTWMQTQDWEGMSLDKDILKPGNKEYNPESCVFVTNQTNCFVINNTNSSGEWPVGVTYHKATGKFMAQLQGRSPRYIGLFSSPEEAHQAWLTEKVKLAKILAEQQTDPRIAKALIERYTNYKGE